MVKKFLGNLSHHDPLYHYLRHEIAPQFTDCDRTPDYQVYRFNGSNDVYLYHEQHCGYQLVGKFFYSHGKNNRRRAEHKMRREFGNLQMLRDLGLGGFPHYVVRPYGYSHDLNCVLVVEYKQGKLFSKVIRDAIYNGGERSLYKKLTALGYFLATFHNRSANDHRVDFEADCRYLDRLISNLEQQGALGRKNHSDLNLLRDAWRGQAKMWEDRQVLVHGDATPDNFMFGRGLDVITFDLERMKWADRVFDLGRVAGELKHFFLLATRNRHAAESFIGHFLWEYCCHFPDRDRVFRSITSRIPFHIGLTLLRIARNSWVSREHREQLIAEAINNFQRYA